MSSGRKAKVFSSAYGIRKNTIHFDLSDVFRSLFEHPSERFSQ